MAEFTYTTFKNSGIPDGHQVLKWLDEANKLDNNKYCIQGYEIRYGLFYRKSMMKYELLCNYSKQEIYKYSGSPIELQVINISGMGGSTLNEIMGFLIGFVNGYSVGINSFVTNNVGTELLNVKGEMSYD